MAIRFLYFFILSIAIASCSVEPASPRVVAIQPLLPYSSTSLDSIAAGIERYYGFETQVLDPIAIPKAFFVNVKSPRYRADSLLNYLQSLKPENADFILGFTASDISTTKRDASGNVLQPASRYEDWGVFGYGQRPGCACVLSSFRVPSEAGRHVERLQKIAIHELGHNLGLDHCTADAKCVMRDAAEKLSTIDHIECALCTSCQTKIK